MDIKTRKWLKDNAYAVKGKDCWFLPDFPNDRIPDRLEIPMNERSWREITEHGELTAQLERHPEIHRPQEVAVPRAG
uniref:Uncharacterized protein n=1 Tax=viral metagenome TaxID=1070528 RepID=A0A6M3JLH0_9ZZZZ